MSVTPFEEACLPHFLQQEYWKVVRAADAVLSGPRRSRTERGVALKLKGNAYFHMGGKYYGEAVANLRAALEFFRPRSEYAARCYVDLSLTYGEMGDDTTALRYATRYLSLYESVACPEIRRWYGRLMLALGTMYLNLGKLAEAERSLSEAAAFFVDVDHPRERLYAEELQQKSQHNLGLVLIEQGRLDDAAVVLQKAHEHLPDDGRAAALHSWAEWHLRAGDLDAARSYVLQAAADTHAGEDAQAEVLLTWARLEALAGDRDTARRYAAEALAVASRCLYAPVLHRGNLFLRELTNGADPVKVEQQHIR